MSGKPKIGLINPQPYMSKYLKELEEHYELTILNPGTHDHTKESMKKFADEAKEKGLECVVGLAQKDAWHHVLINRMMGAVSISSLAYLVSMNKYMQRLSEAKTPYMQNRSFFFAPVTPETETNEEILAKIPDTEWPIMLKNTSLSLGRGVFYVRNKEKLFSILDTYRANTELQQQIKNTNDSITCYFTEEDTKKLETEYGGVVPPFLLEHCVNLDDGWVEYCYEGCINEDGTLTHYGFTEELYSTEHAGLAYITPPLSFPRSDIPELKKYIEGYMNIIIQQGYRRQYFNVEIWALKKGNSLEFAWCEINPRCAHAYHIPYQIAYNTNLWSDNFQLVAYDKAPVNTPWKRFQDGDSQISVQVLINVVGSEGKKVHEILDYKFVDHIEHNNKVELVRHVKLRDYVITKDDAESGAGCTLLQIFKKCDSHSEAAAYEVAIRDLVYIIKQTDKQPDHWLKKSEEFGVDKCKKLLLEGLK